MEVSDYTNKNEATSSNKRSINNLQESKRVHWSVGFVRNLGCSAAKKKVPNLLSYKVPLLHHSKHRLCRVSCNRLKHAPQVCAISQDGCLHVAVASHPEMA